MASNKVKFKNMVRNAKKLMDPNVFWGDSYDKAFRPSNSRLHKKHRVLERAVFPKYNFAETQPEPFKIPIRPKKTLS